MSESTATITLKYPFEWADGETISEIEVPRPKAMHMRGLNIKRLQTDTDEMFKLLQKLLGQPPKFIDKMDFEDVQEIMETVSSFLESGPKTGPTA